MCTETPQFVTICAYIILGAFVAVVTAFAIKIVYNIFKGKII